MIRINRTRRCSLCDADRARLGLTSRGRLDHDRVRLPAGRLPGPGIVICPTHDVAGPVKALPPGLRIACGLEPR